MLLGPDNALFVLKNLVTGGLGFVRQVFFPPQAIATTGTRVTASNSLPADAIVIDADNEDVIVGITLPADFDETKDTDGNFHLKVFLMARIESGTSIALQADSVTRAKVGVALADDADFDPATVTTIDADPLTVEIEADLSALADLAGGDNLHVNFIASARTGSGIAHILGARVEYRSTLVKFDDDGTR